MAANRKSVDSDVPTPPPATTLRAREQQIVAAAIDLAEQQIRDGTVSSQTMAHFLKLGTTREELEQAKLQHEIAVLNAKAEAYASGKRVEELYADALKAMNEYKGVE